MFIFFNKCYYAFIKKFVLKKPMAGLEPATFRLEV